jgi:hypothetical protein
MDGEQAPSRLMQGGTHPPQSQLEVRVVVGLWGEGCSGDVVQSGLLSSQIDIFKTLLQRNEATKAF